MAKDETPDEVRPWPRLGLERIGEYAMFDVLRRRTRSPRNGDTFEYDILEMPDWVNVVPVTTEGRIVLIEQFRQGKEAVTLEFPSGVMEEGEDPCSAGGRELEEETGYRAGRLQKIGTVDPNTALQTNCMHVILAEACEPSGERNLDHGEDVAVHVVEPVEVLDLIDRGRIRHSLAIATWFYYDRHRREGG